MNYMINDPHTSVYSNTIDEVWEKLARIDSVVALHDTFLRTLISKQNLDTTNLQNSIKTQTEEIEKLKDELTELKKFVQYISLPWYKRIFKSFKKYNK